MAFLKNGSDLFQKIGPEISRVIFFSTIGILRAPQKADVKTPSGPQRKILKVMAVDFFLKKWKS